MSRKSSVLVVDDEPNGFTVIRALLKPEGYDLFYVESGREALNQLEAIEPDVILLDVMMPDLDGIATCHEIKSNPDWAHIPIIMVTALNSKQDMARCLETGADDFISKPVSGVELRARVRSMLRIKQQHDALRATLQLREEMSSMMVHDLRTPVATILLGSQMILTQNELESKVQQRLQMVHQAGQKLSSMINELLIMAKLEAGKLLLNQTETDLNALATTVISGFQEIAHSKHIHLETQLPEAGHWIMADVNLLYRLMDNLLSNAFKFSPSGSKITLRVEHMMCPDIDTQVRLQARIQVADEGPGIKEELRQQIFNKYEIGETASDVTQIGLGLTFCKMVVEAHGGRIYVEENSPQGSIFTVEI
jgi:two-component system, sensor histidine kinase and response regulator